MMKIFGIGIAIMAVLTPCWAFGQDDVQSVLDRGEVSQAIGILETQSASTEIEVAVSGMCGRAQILSSNGDHGKAMELLTEAAKKLDSDRHAKKSGYHVIIAYLQAVEARSQGELEAAQGYIKQEKNYG